MSSTASPRTTSEPQTFRADPASTAQRAGRLWRTGKFWIICAAIFVVLSLLAFILAKGGEQSSGTLSITNPAPAGAQGTAEAACVATALA
ncbi:hypothetical protein [Arthrobacter psychrolactophilus]